MLSYFYKQTKHTLTAPILAKTYAQAIQGF